MTFSNFVYEVSDLEGLSIFTDQKKKWGKEIVTNKGIVTIPRKHKIK